MANHPLITVIICTYNTKDLTLRCLSKLKQSIDQLAQPVDTFVIENGSDGSGKVIKKKMPWVKVIEPKQNTGFAKGNNLGINASDKKTSYYLFLNTDALVKKDTLTKSVKFMKQNSEFSVVGCKLKYGNGKTQASAGYLPNPFSVFSWIWGLDLFPYLNRLFKPVHPKYGDFFRVSKKVGWVMGAYLFMKSEVVKKTKGFDDNFFMYMEEVDWCKRIGDSGFNICYTPEFSITHLDKASSRKYPEKMKKIFVNEIVGLVYFLRKYYPASESVMVPLIKTGLLFRTYAFYLLGNRVRESAYREALSKI